jgi:conjugal transfer pilin signal peptidase TrbI
MSAKFYRPLIISGIICGSMLTFYASGLRILINKSESLPGRGYICKLGTPVKRGDLIVFKKDKFPLLLLKRVIGGAGDVVTVSGDQVLLNGSAVGTLQQATSTGEALVPITPQAVPQRILEGQWFVMGSHPRSFDSRYASFGLVRDQDMVGKAWGVF